MLNLDRTVSKLRFTALMQNLKNGDLSAQRYFSLGKGKKEERKGGREGGTAGGREGGGGKS